jgi:hypothetical protein
VDGCTFVPTMSSSLASIYIACASIDCHSTTSFSFDSSIKSIDVVLGHVYKLTHQHFLLLHKNSITDVLFWSISWIIICTNYLFSLYTFLCAHFEDDEECNDNLTTNGWIFNTLSHFSFHNSFLLLFFLVIPLPPLVSIYAHFFVLPFLLL